MIEEDAKHFHQTYKDVCDQFDPSFYYTFKKECDDYFENTHRGNERRGIGGIFYDYKKELPEGSILSPPLEDGGAFWMNFGKACGNAFIDAYLPIVTKRKHTPFNEHNKHWQEIRRGRYVEFNLLHFPFYFGLNCERVPESKRFQVLIKVDLLFDRNFLFLPRNILHWMYCIHWQLLLINR